MRAPDKPIKQDKTFDGYSDAQMQGIRRHFDPEALAAWELKIGAPLQAVLEQAAWVCFTLKLVGTPKQRAEHLRTMIAEIEAVRRRIGSWGIRTKLEDDRTLRAALQSVATKLQQELAAVANAESRSKYNASKSDRDAYLSTLTKIWPEIGGTRTQHGATKALRAFLLDCSSPVCGTNDNAIRHFLYSKTSN